MLRADTPAKVVSERLGHSSITRTLDTYSHVLPTMRRRAADILGRILGQKPQAKAGSVANHSGLAIAAKSSRDGVETGSRDSAMAPGARKSLVHTVRASGHSRS